MVLGSEKVVTPRISSFSKWVSELLRPASPAPQAPQTGPAQQNSLFGDGLAGYNSYNNSPAGNSQLNTELDRLIAFLYSNLNNNVASQGTQGVQSSQSPQIPQTEGVSESNPYGPTTDSFTDISTTRPVSTSSDSGVGNAIANYARQLVTTWTHPGFPHCQKFASHAFAGGLGTTPEDLFPANHTGVISVMNQFRDKKAFFGPDSGYIGQRGDMIFWTSGITSTQHAGIILERGQDENGEYFLCAEANAGNGPANIFKRYLSSAPPAGYGSAEAFFAGRERPLAA